MINHKSDYALNKHSSNIIYSFADGSTIELTPADCPDFEYWKALSDESYHMQELHDRRTSRNDLPLIDNICGDSDDFFEDMPSDSRTMENAMDILMQCLTETQLRRYLMYIRDGKTTRQIAQEEGVGQTAIMDSLHESDRKLKIFLKKA